MKTYAFLDNGVSGSLGIVYPDGTTFYAPTPIKRCLNYTKSKQHLNRIDTDKLRAMLRAQLVDLKNPYLLLLERPMVNPMRWKASVSAIRALEATLIVVEELQIPYQYVDSKEWQRVMLPANVTSDELKTASKEIAERLFPGITFKKDGDSMLGAEWARRKAL